MRNGHTETVLKLHEWNNVDIFVNGTFWCFNEFAYAKNMCTFYIIVMIDFIKFFSVAYMCEYSVCN